MEVIMSYSISLNQGAVTVDSKKPTVTSYTMTTNGHTIKMTDRRGRIEYSRAASSEERHNLTVIWAREQLRKRQK